MIDDTYKHKWDCDIQSDSGGCFLQDDKFDIIDISQEKKYIGKTVRLLKDVEMKTNARYYDEDSVYNDWFETWGYVDRFMFELIPDTMFMDGGENEAHLGRLIAVLDKKK